MNDFLKSKHRYMLFILPFLVAGILFLNEYVPGAMLGGENITGVFNFSFITRLNRFWQLIVGGGLILVGAYLVFYISERFKLFQQVTTLPSLIYVLIITKMMTGQHLDSLSVAMLILAFAVVRLQCAINDLQRNNTLYDFGFLVMLAVMVYPKYILLILWALCVGFFSGRSTSRDIVALLFGILTPIMFLLFGYFWIGELDALPELFINSLMLGEYLHRVTTVEMIRLGIFLFLLLVALYHLLHKYSLLIVSLRRGIFSLVSLLLFLIPTVFVIPLSYPDFICIIAFPLAYIYTQYFISNRIVLFGNLMFVLFLGACFIDELLMYNWKQLFLWW